jgi:hypothetical protein
MAEYFMKNLDEGWVNTLVPKLTSSDSSQEWFESMDPLYHIF